MLFRNIGGYDVSLFFLLIYLFFSLRGLGSLLFLGVNNSFVFLDFVMYISFLVDVCIWIFIFDVVNIWVISLVLVLEVLRFCLW